jgi:hypothetical protein
MSAFAAMTSKALVNGAWREVVNIRSTKMLNKFVGFAVPLRDSHTTLVVMAGLVPAIHVFASARK